MLAVNHTTHELIQSYLEALNCPRSLSVWLMFRENEHDQILKLEVNPDFYLDVDQFRDAYLATKFLSKADFLSTSVDKKQTAIDNFLACEEACMVINRDSFRTAAAKNSKFEWIHRESKRIVRTILSCSSSREDEEDFHASEFFDCANWGPGVTTLIKGDDTSSTNKFRLEGGITQPLLDFVGGLFATAYPHWKPDFRIQLGSKIVTVPKNSKTDRVIAIEPGINLWFQKSIGTMIRRRLSRYGLDLNTQNRNQHLAWVASRFSNLATVDFSSASDSISYKTVEELIPLRWFTLMDLCRSKSGVVEKKTVHFEKFSSMGNGFTFELESLIFYSIALAVVSYLKLNKKDVSVYGDDVIIPIHAFDLFQSICAIYGFTVNKQKSYFSGYFRESCGSHFYNGVDCKPYYLKEVVKRESEVYIAGNNVRRISRLNYGCDTRFRHCHDSLVKRISPLKRCYISEGFGDGGFIENLDIAVPSRARHGIEGYYAKSLLTIPLGYFSSDHALFLARLKDCSNLGQPVNLGGRNHLSEYPIFRIKSRYVSRSFGNETFLRGKVRYVRKKILIQQWNDLGPWL